MKLAYCKLVPYQHLQHQFASCNNHICTSKSTCFSNYKLNRMNLPLKWSNEVRILEEWYLKPKFYFNMQTCQYMKSGIMDKTGIWLRLRQTTLWVNTSNRMLKKNCISILIDPADFNELFSPFSTAHKPLKMNVSLRTLLQWYGFTESIKPATAQFCLPVCQSCMQPKNVGLQYAVLTIVPNHEHQSIDNFSCFMVWSWYVPEAVFNGFICQCTSVTTPTKLPNEQAACLQVLVRMTDCRMLFILQNDSICILPWRQHSTCDKHDRQHTTCDHAFLISCTHVCTGMDNHTATASQSVSAYSLQPSKTDSRTINFIFNFLILYLFLPYLLVGQERKSAIAL